MDEQNLEKFTIVPNETLERLCKTRLSSDAKVLLAVIRKTLGFHKRLDQIAYSQLQSMTGIKSNNINKPLNKLEKLGIIKRDRKNIILSPLFFQWIPSNRMAPTIKNDGKTTYNLMDTKERKKEKYLDKDNRKERASNETIDKTRQDLVEQGILRPDNPQ